MQEDILNKFFHVVKKHLPAITLDKITIFDNGHDHYVLLANNHQAFRFPRTPNHGKKDEVINLFSQKFASMSPVPIQKMKGQTDTETSIKYQIYDFIPGISLSKEKITHLTQQELLDVAKDLGNFLTVLHRFPLDEARKMNIDSLISAKDYGEYFKDIIKVDKKLIYPFLTEDEWKWVENTLMGFYNLTTQYDFTLTLTHSDLLADHILINKNTKKLCGILDFALRIADPANDFKLFDEFGADFLKIVYDNYPPVDEFFDKRRQFYTDDLRIANLYQSVERGDPEAVQKKYQKILKEYILMHPKSPVSRNCNLNL